MRKLAVSARDAEPVPTMVDSATRAVAVFPSASGALDSSYEDGERTSSWNKQAG